MYGPLITFEMKVNPITHGGTVRVNPMPNGASVWNGPPYQGNCLFLYFSTDSTPFLSTAELWSNHFYQNITFVPIIFSFFSLIYLMCQIPYPLDYC